MYQKVSTDMNFAQREEEVIKFWRDEDIFKKTVKLRERPPLRSSTARRPPTASRTSATWKRARSRTSSRATAR